MRGVIVAVVIAVVVIVIGIPAVAIYSGFAPFLEVKDEIDSMNKSPGEMTSITDAIKEKDVVMAFIDANPGGYEELLEEPFVGTYNYEISALDGPSRLAIEYVGETGQITSQIYDCADADGNIQSFDVDLAAKIASGEC